MNSNRSARVMRRVADALGLPIEALLAVNDDADTEAFPSLSETSDLLTAFVALTSPQARRRVISAAQAEARKANIA